MRERAERVGADLAIEARHDGGTTVTLRSLPISTGLTVEEGNHRDQRLARR
jgi:nitrate/nitrite-specific signal transduction histidine kinase